MSTPNNTVCCIIDPYVSSEILCDALLEKNILPIAILTKELNLTETEQNNRYSKSKFHKIMHFKDEDDLKFIEKELSDFRILAVIAGNERTCHIADHIAKKLAPKYANSEKTSIVRMDKYEMHEALEKAKLPHIQQVLLAAAELTSEQINSLLDLGFPIIVKPTNQSGSFGVIRCDSIAELQTAVRDLLGNKSNYGTLVDACVAQKCIEGEEYFVDTVSYASETKIVGVYRYQKFIYEQKPIYRYCEVVDPTSVQAQLCVDYVKKILPTLGLNYGMAHTELFLTSSGPLLIEVNPRISGLHGFIAHLTSVTLGKNQAQILAESLADTASFLATVNELPKFLQPGKIVILQSWHSKTLKRFSEDKVINLTSYNGHKLIKKIGQRIGPPKDLQDVVAAVILSDNNREQIKSDYQELLSLEENDLIFN